jgi:dUTP pyrophosphatase
VKKGKKYKKMAAEVPRIPTAILKIFVEDEDLKQEYIKHVKKHNNKILSTTFPDSGFDLLLPEDTRIKQKTSKFIDFKVKCEMTFNGLPAAFTLYPRSSTFNKYNIMLTNSVGIIDCGYRGNIGGSFYSPENETDDTASEFIIKNSRVAQICTPLLIPIIVEIVDKSDDLTETTRGEGGFGSTGK